MSMCVPEVLSSPPQPPIPTLSSHSLRACWERRGQGWTNFGRAGGVKEGSEPAVLSVSGVSLVLSNIKDSWPVCVHGCVRPCVCVLFMCSLFLGDFPLLVQHSMAVTEGRQKDRGGCTVNPGITCLLYNNISRLFYNISSNNCHICFFPLGLQPKTISNILLNKKLV